MSAPAPRKRTTTRKTPAKPKPAAPGVIVLDRKENVDKLAEREPLFSVDGVVHTIPKHVPASWTIEATKLATEVSEAAALAYVIDKMLSTESYEALQSCETLTKEDLNDVVQILADKVLPASGSAFPKAS